MLYDPSGAIAMATLFLAVCFSISFPPGATAFGAAPKVATALVGTIPPVVDALAVGLTPVVSALAVAVTDPIAPPPAPPPPVALEVAS